MVIGIRFFVFTLSRVFAARKREETNHQKLSPIDTEFCNLMLGIALLRFFLSLTDSRAH